MDFSGYSYLGWNDAGSGRKYMIVDAGGKLTGIHGTIKSSNKKESARYATGPKRSDCSWPA
ncbi:hypothetical protein PO124_29410 [Bacillus licheniformis]|nr:hypothetical protein [Bacillus licheniformis]